MQLTGKVAFITGSGGGIGKAAAQLFAAEGATVIIADIMEKDIQTAAAEIKSAGGDAHAWRLDVTSEKEWLDTQNYVREQFGRLDVLVNNAGIRSTGSLLSFDYTLWRKIIDVNLHGSFLGVKYMAPLMIEAGHGGVIITTCSDASECAFPNSGCYCVSKAGAKMLSRVAGSELAKYNIRCNTIHPAWVDTNMARIQEHKVVDTIEEDPSFFNPLGRVNSPQDIAQAMLFLAADSGRNISGAAIVIDGGDSSFIRDK